MSFAMNSFSRLQDCQFEYLSVAVGSAGSVSYTLSPQLGYGQQL